MISNSVLYSRISSTLLSTLVYFFLAGSGYTRLYAVFTGNSVHSGEYAAMGLLYLSWFILILVINRWIYLAVYPILLVVGTAVSWFGVHFGIDIDSDVLEAVLSTDLNETREILSLDLMVHLGLAIFLGVVLVIHRLRVEDRKKTRFIVISKRVLLLVLLLSGMLLLRFWYVPGQYMFKNFDLKVLNVPSQSSDRDALVRKLWGSGANLEYTAQYRKGRKIDDVYNRHTGQRLRLYASKGDFSLANPIFGGGTIKRYYDRDGRRIKSKLLLDKKFKKYELNRYQPFYFFEQLWYQIQRQRSRSIAASQLDDIAGYPSALDELKADDLITVLIIGESARADHFHLNGYPRKTTPRLSGMSDLINFPHVRSCAASTTLAIPCMLTRMQTSELPKGLLEAEVKTYIYQPIASENSFISLFSKHDFHTAWLSLNQIYGRKNEPISVMVNDVHVQKFLTFKNKDYEYAQDSLLITEFDQFLETYPGKKLVILHTRGSHWKYSARYPEAFRIFKPACTKSVPPKCKAKALINAYDNTILYTDYFISEIIERLKGRKALLIYTADHGESLGERGIYTHSVMSRPEQRNVPMIWWVSEKWRQSNPKAYSNLLDNAQHPINHDYLFHSLLDCSGIRSEVVDLQLSLCQKIN